MLNDLARAALMMGLRPASAFFTWQLERRIARYAADQSRLRSRYGVAPDTPIRGFDDTTRAAIESFAAAHPDARLAYTSGSTSRPKGLAYTRRRLANFKRGSQSAGARAWIRHALKQPGIFVLASLSADESFTSLVVRSKRTTPRWLDGLIEPAKYLTHPAVSARIDRLGPTAARLWLMALNNPGLVYSTNPSTLAVFLTELHEDWHRVTALAREELTSGGAPDLLGVARRVRTRGWRQRLTALATATSPPPIADWWPALGAYCCWDGGYTTPFVAQIRRFLPAERYVHIPMYSMSTETIETLTWFDRDGTTRFLPIAPDVLYEFLPEHAPDLPDALLLPSQLEPGRLYAMVVSDCYGLTRYQTEDLFSCQHLVRGVPDLRFIRRRGLTWSFTGEKLTGEQLTEAWDLLAESLPALTSVAAQLTCFPSLPPGPDTLPRYRVVLCHPGRTRPPALDEPHFDPAALALAFDRALASLNHEYADKRASGRLAPADASVIPYDRLAAALHGGADDGRRGWDSQFKLTPLAKRPWEDFAALLATR